MAKETCTSCGVRLPSPISFCPACSSPTRYATDAERIEHDLQRWRAHVSRTVAAGGVPAVVAPVATRTAPPPIARTVPPRADAVAPVQAAPSKEPKARRALRVPRVHVPRPRVPRPRVPRPRVPRIRRSDPVQVIDLDANHEFVYRACVTCRRTDWLLRGTRNGDGTWNYWCVRCSRSFKTELRLHQAVKPFLSAGIVLGGITAASMLMLR